MTDSQSSQPSQPRHTSSGLLFVPSAPAGDRHQPGAGIDAGISIAHGQKPGAKPISEPVSEPVSKPASGSALDLDLSLPELRQGLAMAMAQVNAAILGKENEVRLTFACLLARGHLLIEDLPGMGKTTLAQTLARALGMQFKRIQCTCDLMPADVVGFGVPDGSAGGLRFHPGPVFTHLLLADEINRASPRTQSALLEAMAERQVTLDGVTRRLPDPFLVVATQNPVDMAGTFALPDSQMDRFLVRLRLGYPDSSHEIALMLGASSGDTSNSVTSAGITSGAGHSGHHENMASEHAASLPAASKHEHGLGAAGIVSLQAAVARDVHVSAALAGYAHRLVQATRANPAILVGLSPRASLALVQMARAIAFLDGRRAVEPEDVQVAFPAVADHRLVLHANAEGGVARLLINEILANTDV